MITLSPRITPRRIARWALVLAALYGVGWLLWSARSALTPFIFGVFLAYLFLPLVNRLNRRMPRWGAILTVYLFVLGLIVTFFAFLVPPLVEQFGQLIRAIPSVERFQQWGSQISLQYEKILANLPPQAATTVRDGVASLFTNLLNTLRTNFVDYLQGLGNFLLDSALSIVNTVTFLLGFFLIPFWLFYVLMDQRAGAEIVNRSLHHRIRTDFWSVATILDRVFSGYLRGQLILGLAVGSAAGIGLLALELFGLHVNYILLLAVIAGMTELVPVIGPILGAIPAVILGFVDSPTTGLAVLALYIAIQQLENNFLVPRIVGDSVGLHPAVLMVLLVVCSQVFGLLGAILSAPLGAVSRDVFTYLYGRLSDPPRPAGELPERLRNQELLDDPGPPVTPDVPGLPSATQPDQTEPVVADTPAPE